MSVEDPDRPPDPDGPHGRWWEHIDTLGWAAQRHDADTFALDQGATAVLDLLIGRCSAQLHPRDRATAPTGQAAARVQARQHHLSRLRERLTTDITIAEVRALLTTYGPLARADLDDPTVDQRLDELAADK